ncbi:MAG: HlyD family efflux transporter periplasmic adaptor subunit [Planctomycetes bacterium]|nr:HlyD family efflux transporter periplasmic adaptor subunit [Planctomycetota bacterium]
MTNKDNKSSQKLLWRILIAQTILLLIAGVMLARNRRQTPTENTGPAQTHVAEQRNLTISVIESGELEARYTTEVKCQIEGKDHTIIYLIPEGTILTEQDVENGTVLVEFDSVKLKEIEVTLDVAYNAAIAANEEALRNHDIQVQQNISDITAAKLQQTFALMDLRKYLGTEFADEMLAQNNGEEATIIPQVDSSVLANIDEDTQGQALQSLRELQNSIENAQESVQRNDSKLEGTRKLFENKYVTKMELDADEAAANQAERSLTSRETALDLFMKYDFEKQAKQLYSNYQESIRQVLRIQAYADARLSQSKARLAATTIGLQRQEEYYRRTQAALAACTIRAPVAGMIVYYQERSRGGRNDNRIELGGTARYRQKLMTIPSTNEMAVRVEVHEAWIDKIKINQVALITLDAYPDQTFTGSIYQVALLPSSNDSWFSSSDLKLYECLVSIDGDQSQIRDGMSAKVEIIIERLENIVSVPVQAVATVNSQKVCYVIDKSGQPQPRNIEVGAFNNDFIEIKSGLTPGETVSLSPVRHRPSLDQREQQKQILIEKALKNKEDS